MMDNFSLQSLILVLGLLSFAISQYNTRIGSPILAILNRWIRWIFIAVALGGIIYMMGWTPYPLGVLISVFFLIWFFIETAYNWLAIQALSRSEIPLFPHFVINEKGDQWPSENRFIRIRDFLRREGFTKVQSLVSFINDQILMRLIAYENETKTIRIHILLLPNQKGSFSVCFSLLSRTKEDIRLITDNIFLPFGGFYPENWEVERKPLYRSLEKVLYRHRARMDAIAQEFLPFEEEPSEQINEDQKMLEKLNRNLGFLNKRALESEAGKLTPAGRARVWQEIWTLSYFGKSLKYQ